MAVNTFYCVGLCLSKKKKKISSPVLISEPLEIITQPGSDEEDRFVDHGAKVILTCEAKGLPLPSYQWFHNNQALPKENGTQLCLDNIK